MKKSNLALAATVSSLLAIGTLVSSPAMAAGKEKCYGVAAAGQNDCATKSSSCAGTSKVDNQGDAFIAVPKGLCDKLSGGSLKPIEG
ncbi:DUF2282 domain-containing protein [Psychromonas sp. SR45-3]|uniref:BufA1 family periplasmic bufferin-type metallophore n=1 Tax=Psychromonas sp. SR45-3 TaxID=2760930 RepID=UPI0015F8F539|nr:DUF2282 domain-containing protein [Psychromonas sp. SR45-3]MBB1274683.1 DUF2282 domain-containing protein [Psychromonas sp. SR45-3]